MKALYHLGNLFVLGLLILGCMAYCHNAHAACGGFDLMLDVYADGHHSVVINPDFVSHDACVRAGMAASARWAHLGEKVDFVCVSHK